MMQRWDWFLGEYHPYTVPAYWNCVTYAADMESMVSCANCGELIPYGESYTSVEIHDHRGFGYAVCAKCYEAEWFRRLTATEREKE